MARRSLLLALAGLTLVLLVWRLQSPRSDRAAPATRGAAPAAAAVDTAADEIEGARSEAPAQAADTARLASQITSSDGDRQRASLEGRRRLDLSVNGHRAPALTLRGRVLLPEGAPSRGIVALAIAKEFSRPMGPVSQGLDDRGGFALELDRPQSVSVEVRGAGSDAPLFKSDFLDVPEGFDGTFPELDPIDLRQALVWSEIQAFDASDGSAVERAYAVLDDGLTFDGSPLRVVTAARGVHAVVRAPGYRLAERTLDLPLERVMLSRAGDVVLVLPSDLPALPSGAKLKVSLQLLRADSVADPGRSSRAWQNSALATFEKDGTARAPIEVDGLYSASFTLFYESRSKSTVAGLRGPSEHVHISVDSGTAVVGPDRDAYVALVASLR